MPRPRKATVTLVPPVSDGDDHRSAKGLRTRARIIEAGKVVFARDGFLKARITDIARVAGVSYGAFYHYFDSKEVIFREIAEEMEVRLLALDDRPPDEAHEHEPFERIRDANRSYLAAYRKDAEIMRVIEEVSRYDDEVRAVRDRRQDEFGARLASSIGRLQRTGMADSDVNGRYAAMALGGMVATFAEDLFVAGGNYDFDTAVEQLTILWANALGIPRPGKNVQPVPPVRAARKRTQPAARKATNPRTGQRSAP